MNATDTQGFQVLAAFIVGAYFTILSLPLIAGATPGKGLARLAGAAMFALGACHLAWSSGSLHDKPEFIQAITGLTFVFVAAGVCATITYIWRTLHSLEQAEEITGGAKPGKR